MGEYNLIDEAWIPTDKGLKSIKDIFTDTTITDLNGNPVEKISILKLLLAIAQSAYTPENDEKWEELGVEGLSIKCVEYLEKWHHKFYLFGDEPFLQIKEINKYKESSKKNDSLDDLNIEVASGNTSLLFHSQLSKDYSYSDIALLLITQIGYGVGGKSIDNSIILTNKSGYNEVKKKTGKAGVFLGFLGYLHTFVTANSILDTIYLNLFCMDKINDLLFFENGLGTPPWEKMPETETCEVAENMKKSFIGRLVPLSRFCIFEKIENSITVKVTDGIYHLFHQDGAIDTSITTYQGKKGLNAIWVNVDKKPWRNLTAFLSSIYSQDSIHNCLQVSNSFKRARKNYKKFYIWSGGVKVTSNSGEQYLSGNDNYIESIVEFSSVDTGKNWYKQFKLEMDELEEKIAYILKKSIEKYYKSLKEEKDVSNYISQFWELCETHLNELLQACNSNDTKQIRKKFLNIAYDIYDLACPKISAKQIKTWAENRPNFYKYINNRGA